MAFGHGEMYSFVRGAVLSHRREHGCSVALSSCLLTRGSGLSSFCSHCPSFVSVSGLAPKPPSIGLSLQHVLDLDRHSSSGIVLSHREIKMLSPHNWGGCV